MLLKPPSFDPSKKYPVLIVLQRGVVEREEAYLQAKFGEDYRKYQSRVPRWL